ncbi:hypothetical protein QR680_005923 [Steinernema hermaphroditum]|uniref:Fungal lipase-type domain-containing protein n=1 Tax=Steinernema hermaphroditum TaxID=289476 RepID=A0AA39HW14_9BILA|nr:hypothetical protein QR680_005923 [Steinernema hermaphroditum]
MKFFSALLVLCLLSAAVGSVLQRQNLQAISYEDSIGRDKLMPMSAAAYADDPLPCIQTVFDRRKVELIGSASASCDFSGDSCSAFVVVSHQDGAVIVAFRGAENSQELNDLLNKKETELEDFVGGGQVAKGYHDAVTNLERNGLKDMYLAGRNANPTYQIWVTGHNVGGAMASLWAAKMVYAKWADPDDLLLMTFGQPRVGDSDFATVHDDLVRNSYRVVHKRDGIAHLPPLDITPFKHHRSEVWYDNGMKEGDSYQECRKDDEGCSDSAFLTNSVLDDYYYYATSDSINKWGQKGCPAAQ